MADLYGDFDDSDDIEGNDEDIGALNSLLSWDDDDDGVQDSMAAATATSRDNNTNSTIGTLPDLLGLTNKDGQKHYFSGNNIEGLQLPMPTRVSYSQTQSQGGREAKREKPAAGFNQSQNNSRQGIQFGQHDGTTPSSAQPLLAAYAQQQRVVGAAAPGGQQLVAQPTLFNMFPQSILQPQGSTTVQQQQQQQQHQQQQAVSLQFPGMMLQQAMTQQSQNLQTQQLQQAPSLQTQTVQTQALPNQQMQNDQQQQVQFNLSAEQNAFFRQLQMAQMQQQFNVAQQLSQNSMSQQMDQTNRQPQPIAAAPMQPQMQFSSRPMPLVSASIGAGPGPVPGAASGATTGPVPAGGPPPAKKARISAAPKKDSIELATVAASGARANIVSASDTDGEASAKFAACISAPSPKLVSASKSKRVKPEPIDTSNMSPEEKAKANRDRNREHARNTRLRKKAYLEKLKATVDELCRERDTLVSERAGAASLLVEMHNTRTEVLMSFFALRSANEKRRELWGSILDESCFACVLPVTPYRSFPACEVQVSKCQRTILGIDGMMSDTASLHVLLNSLVDRSRFPNGKVEFRYTLVTEESVVAGNQLMARWVMTTLNATQCGARMEVAKQGMLCCKFNSAHKIIAMELMFDVMAFMLQLKQATGSDSFSIIPNTVQTCQRSFDRPMVMTVAEAPYTIIQVNKLWEDMTGYKAEEVVGKTSCRILQGRGTEKSELDSLMHEVRFKRPASTALTNYKKTGQRFRNFLLLYPLSTDSKISHYLALTGHVSFIDGIGVSDSGVSAAAAAQANVGKPQIPKPLGVTLPAGLYSLGRLSAAAPSQEPAVSQQVLLSGLPGFQGGLSSGIGPTGGPSLFGQPPPMPGAPLAPGSTQVVPAILPSTSAQFQAESRKRPCSDLGDAMMPKAASSDNDSEDE